MLKDLYNALSILLSVRTAAFSFLIFIVVLSVLFESFGFALIVPLMESLLDSESKSSIGIAFEKVFYFFGIEPTVFNTCALFFGVILVKNSLIIFRAYLKSEFSYGVKIHAMESLKSSYLNMPLETYFKKKQGDLINNIIVETQNTAVGIMQLTELLTGVLLVPLFFGLMIASSPELTFGMIFFGGSIYLVLGKFVGSYARSVGTRELALNQDISSQVNENLAGMKSIRVLGMIQTVSQRFSSSVKAVKKLLVRWDTISNSTVPIAEVCLVVVVVGYISYVSGTSGQGEFKDVLPVLSMIVIVAYRTMTQVSKILVNRLAVERYLPSMRLVTAMMRDSSIPLSESKRVVRGNNFDKISFTDVCFHYEAGKPVLAGTSFNIFKGQTTILIGPSGSGKTTIIDLLLGLYRPTSGCISVDDIPLDQMCMNVWRADIGYVGQDVFLFHGSIEENLTVGDSRLSLSQIREVTKRVGLDDFIIGLPNGYATEVGDRGVMLSGGQRQRVSIARALLKAPDILVMDEATSALDHATSTKLNAQLFAVMEQKTVIAITHKPDLLEYADQVIKITEVGNKVQS